LNVLNNSAKVLAPAIGTVSSSRASEAFALLMSLTFSAASLIAFAFIRLGSSELASDSTGGRAPPTAITTPHLTPLLWVATTSAFFIFMVNNLFPLVLQRAGFDKALLGLLVSCSGAGSILSGLWLARQSASKAMRGEIGEMMLPATLQAIGFGLIGVVLWFKPDPVAVILPLLFFLIGTFSARYVIAMNVHVAAHFAGSIGRFWGVLQAWQSAMILVAPLVGAIVLDAMGAAALFAFSTGSALISFSLFYLLRTMGMPRLQVPRPTAQRESGT
jgi:hypothetical protein